MIEFITPRSSSFVGWCFVAVERSKFILKILMESYEKQLLENGYVSNQFYAPGKFLYLL